MITLLTGDNMYEIEAKLADIRLDFGDSEGDFSTKTIQLDEVDEPASVISESQNTSLFTTRKLLVLRHPTYSKSEDKMMHDLIAGWPAESQLVIVAPKHKKSGWHKYLGPEAKIIECKNLPPRALQDWVITEAQQFGGQIDRPIALRLIEMVGADQLLLSAEIRKLVDHRSKVEPEDLRLLIDPTPQSSIFSMLEAAFKGRYQKALELYDDQRAQRIEPLQILALLSWQLDIIVAIKLYGTLSDFDLAAQTGLSSFSINRARPVANRLDKATVKKLVRRLLEIDVQLKSSRLDPDDVLKQFILELAV
jgi:DNA polymerase III subunit delta